MPRQRPRSGARWHADGLGFTAAPITTSPSCPRGATAGAPSATTSVVRVTPRAGMVLVFDHPIAHQGAPVERGVKHVLRTDVMYRRDAA